MPVVKKRVAKKRPAKKNQSTGSILDRAQPLHFDDDEGIKINLYGQSGTGKTTVWGTFPGPILALICSGGSQPGELRSLNTPEMRRKIKQFQCASVREVHDIAEAQAQEERYKTVVLDHATGLQDLSVCEVGGLAEMPAQSSWGLLSQQQWGQVALQTKEAMRALLSLRCNIVIVAQERVFKDDSSDSIIKPFVASALTPSTVGWLNPAVDYICQTLLRPKMEIQEIDIAGQVTKIEQPTEEVEYCLRVAPSATYASKFRVPLGNERPQFLVDPTYDKIKKLIRGD